MVLYFLHSTPVLSFYIDLVLTLSIGLGSGLSPVQQRANYYLNQWCFCITWGVKVKVKVKVKEFYCNKIINIHGTTQRLKPIWVYLPHTILASVTLQWPHCGDNRVSRVQPLRRNGHCSSTTAVSSCTKGYHAENLPCNKRRQGWHTDSLRPSE